MSDWPRVIEDEYGEMAMIEPEPGMSCVTIDIPASYLSLTVDQCAALIAAITDAAKIVAGEHK